MAAADEQDLLAALEALPKLAFATASMEAPGRPKSDVFYRQQRTTRARDSFWDPDFEGSIFFF